MSHLAARELLDDLRARLLHFDQTGNIGESETVEEIKRHLRARIAEVEAEVARYPSPALDAPNRTIDTTHLDRGLDHEP